MTGSFRGPVDFVICGTQKGGTTALHAHLAAHSRICMSTKKEVHFFDDESRFERSGVDYADYHAHFEPEPEHVVVGEATPIYLYWKAAPARMRAYNPDLKLVVLLRNPIERAFSHWNMQRSRGREHLGFEEAVHGERDRAREALPLQDRAHSYVDRGFYSVQLERLWGCFGRDRVLVLRSDALRTDPAPALDRITRFLGIDPFEGVRARSANARRYEAPMGDAIGDRLRTAFREEIETLETLLGWDCGDWLDRGQAASRRSVSVRSRVSGTREDRWTSGE